MIKANYQIDIVPASLRFENGGRRQNEER